MATGSILKPLQVYNISAWFVDLDISIQGMTKQIFTGIKKTEEISVDFEERWFEFFSFMFFVLLF